MSVTIKIKNMVCDRCIMAVKQVLSDLDIDFQKVSLGKVEVKNPVSPEKITELDQKLRKIGFEIITDKNKKIAENIKNEIINLVFKHPDLLENLVLSKYLTQKFYQDYSSLSKIFSETEGITIEKFFISIKIEKVKELISYDEMNLTEISYLLGYSSSQHLSNQFKKITGQTPTQYKKSLNRKKLNDL